MEYDPGISQNNISQVANTFAYPFDYRDPVGKSGAVLIYETNDIRNDGNYVFTPAEQLTGRQVLYVTADIQSFDIEDLDMLPNLTTQKTELGANFTSVLRDVVATGGSSDYTPAYDITATHTVSITYNHRYRSNKQWIDEKVTQTHTVTETIHVPASGGSSSGGSSTINLARKGRNGANGSRVLIPYRHVLYAPNDFYSKYYRIPALAKAADGSVIAISDARKYHIHDIENDIDMLARRSTDNGKTWTNPVTIAKGSSPVEGSCSGANGYGDAAIAALPNGDVLVTMVHGNRIASSDQSWPTKNFYCISHDNGQSWSQPKEIDIATLVWNERGCIAPGNILVVKNGKLAGKVLACFRSYLSLEGYGAYKNYFLVYDPETDNWSRLDNATDKANPNSFKNTASSDGADDEAHLVEIGVDQFLMTIRSGAGREFAVITINSYPVIGDHGSSGTFSGVNKGHNMSVNACNGDIMPYDAVLNGQNRTFLLHTLPKGTTTGQNGQGGGGRTGVRMYYTTYNAGGNLQWNFSTCVSDPYDNEDIDRKETAQYSSLTTLGNDLVAVLFEEYPQVIRINDDRGDYLMQSVYELFRIGDLVPGASKPDKEYLLPPTITPPTATFDSNNPADRPNPIVIGHENVIQDVITRYKFYVYDADNVLIGYDWVSFDDANSRTFNWNDITVKDQRTNQMVTLQSLIADGVRIKVSALCSKEGYYDSPIASQTYYFRTPVRRLQILARQQEAWGDPYLQIEFLGTIPQGQIITVAQGSLVYANAQDKYPYKFKGFSTHGDQYVAPNQAILDALAMVPITPHQYNATVPSASIVPDNYDSDGDGVNDCLTIYAWYESYELGLKTRVYTNYFDSNENVDGTRHYFHNDWYPVLAHAGNEFPKAAPGLTMDNVAVKGNNYATTNLQYNLSLYKQGLDTRVVVMPDSRALEYSGIVMVKNSSTDSYVTKPNRAPATNDSKYYVLQGSSVKFAENSPIVQNATGVLDWFTYNEFGQIMPVMVEDILFEGLVPKGVDSYANGDFDIEVYLTKNTDIQSVGELAQEANYGVKIVHRVRQNTTDITTPVDDLATSRSVRSVRYYNPSGMMSDSPFTGINIIVTEYSDGTRTVHKVMK